MAQPSPTPPNVTALIQEFSADRFASYQTKTGGDDVRALALYEWNSALCASFYPPLQAVEVGFRNACHRSMQAKFGLDWPLDPAFLGLNISIHKQIEQAISRQRQAARQKLPKKQQSQFVYQPFTPQVIAGLSLGFWTMLLGKEFDVTLWRTALCNAFRAYTSANGANVARSRAAGLFNDVRIFRNRVFHHEPLWKRRSLQDDLDRLFTAAGWISPELETWTRSQGDACATLIAKGPPP